MQRKMEAEADPEPEMEAESGADTEVAGSVEEGTRKREETICGWIK